MREVYILAGQSNVIGINTGTAPVYNANIHKFNQPWHTSWGIPVANPANTGSWAQATNPLHSDPQCGIGPGMAFADELIALRGDSSLEVGLVPCGWGGSDISGLWANQYLWWSAFGMMLARMHKAREWGPIKGFIWYQGEAEARSSYPSYYQKEMFRLIQAVRFELLETIPVIVTKLGPCPNPSIYPGWALMQNYFDQMVGVDPKLKVVSAADLTLVGDGSPHLNAASCDILGRRYATAMHSMVA